MKIQELIENEIELGEARCNRAAAAHALDTYASERGKVEGLKIALAIVREVLE